LFTTQENAAGQGADLPNRVANLDISLGTTNYKNNSPPMMIKAIFRNLDIFIFPIRCSD